MCALPLLAVAVLTVLDALSAHVTRVSANASISQRHPPSPELARIVRLLQVSTGCSAIVLAAVLAASRVVAGIPSQPDEVAPLHRPHTAWSLLPLQVALSCALAIGVNTTTAELLAAVGPVTYLVVGPARLLHSLAPFERQPTVVCQPGMRVRTAHTPAAMQLICDASSAFTSGYRVLRHSRHSQMSPFSITSL